MIEDKFDTPLTARLSQREKQIQQRYRPVIGVHKWFARRPGALFRSLLLSEFSEGGEPLAKKYFQGNDLSGRVVGDPFMGGGTPLFEANRAGCSVVGADINPMSYWVVKQELADLNLEEFREAADEVVSSVESQIGDLYNTECTRCGEPAGVKYFLWVKVINCQECGDPIHLFRSYRVAKNERHPNYVILCSHCHELNEVESEDELEDTACSSCGEYLQYDGPARRKYSDCPSCGAQNSAQPESGVPEHYMYAIEYNCSNCYSEVDGRQFKAPDEDDRRKAVEAAERLEAFGDRYIPDDEIPNGDESDRLLRWGYEKYREVFNDRQLYGLSVLKKEIEKVDNQEVREALITVFSDFLRYQNMVCRYDKWALKIQDIFSVHGFPVSLEQCENSLLGVPDAGSGGYRHFLKKYERAKKYCEEPYECTSDRTEKHTKGEEIRANFVERPEDLVGAPPRSATLHAEDSADLDLDGLELDGVFTDPPYFANVQYAELIDFCYVWIKDFVNGKASTGDKSTTRRTDELTVNETENRGLKEFTEGLSDTYSNFASALKPSAPFVFTYHHNEFEAYIPVVVAILDAELVCTSTLACPAEMGASVHISGTSSSVVDSVFVCRGMGRINPREFELTREALESALLKDLSELKEGGLSPSMGDARCILLGHIARLLIWHLRNSWNPNAPTEQKIYLVREKLEETLPSGFVDNLTDKALDGLESFDQKGTLFGNGFGAQQEKTRTIEFTWSHSAMSQPYEADALGSNAELDDYVEQVFGNLQSEILILPKADSMAELEQFEQAFEALRQHTNGLADVTVGNLVSAINQDPVVFILVRVILGLTPTEWAKLAEEETGVDIPQGYARDIDTKAIHRPLNFLGASDKRAERIGALLQYAVGVLNEGIGEIPDDVNHRFDMADKGPDTESLSTLAEEGVPYERLLFERYRGRPFASYRDAVSEKVGNRMEDAVESELKGAGVSYYRTGRTEELSWTNQAPDFVIPSKDNPQVVIEAKITGDDGTARDKVTRIQRLRTLSDEWADSGGDPFQVVACIDGRGFGVRSSDMRKLLRATNGKVFTTKTLDQLVGNTEISKF